MPPDVHSDRILILDFGAQYTQLIARRVCASSRSTARSIRTTGIVAAHRAPGAPRGHHPLGRPVERARAGRAERRPGDLRARRAGARHLLRLQLLCAPARRPGREGGRSRVRPRAAEARARRTRCSRRCPAASSARVWMSHGDRVLRLPPGFEVIATSDDSPFAAVAAPSEPLVGVQFHPEVVHTEAGGADPAQLRARHVRLRGHAGRRPPSSRTRSRACASGSAAGASICGLSGGVDSSVAAALVHRAIGDRLHLHLRRPRPAARGRARARSSAPSARRCSVPLVTVDAARPLPRARSRGVSDPEKKRAHHRPPLHRGLRRDGAAARRRRLPGAGHALPRRDRERLGARARRPRSRRTTTWAACPSACGSSWSSRCASCSRTRCAPRAASSACPRRSWAAIRSRARASRSASSARSRASASRCCAAADAILIEEIRRRGLYDEIWQAFAVFLPVQSVGVMGDERTYDHVIGAALRDVGGRDDRGLGAPAARAARPRLEPHHERGEGREPRRLRRLVEAARHDRVGVAWPRVPFTHLHLHTQYSLLDGAIKHDPLFERARGARPGQPSR